MRASIAVLAACLFMAQAASVSTDDLLARGRASYDAGRYADAVKDLSAAADAIVAPAQMQQYVSGGKFEELPKFEKAVIYLVMSYAKLGRDADAREQIQRLVAAETIAPTYASLSLDADVAGFEDLVKRLSPAMTLAWKGGAPSPSAAQTPAPTTAEGRVAPQAPQTTTLTPVKVAEARGAPTPSPPPMPVSAPAPAPVPAPKPSAAPPPAAATTTTASATPALPADAMSKTETTTAPAPPPATSGGRMNLLFAVILIIVGIGVLVILFRGSD